MATEQTAFRSSKSIAGAVLAVLGMFPLYENVAGTVARLSHLFANGSQALGAFPTFVLGVSQAVHTFGFDHQRPSQGLFQQLLVSSWPLLLVIVGTVLSTDSCAIKSKAHPRK
jgi:hypothetical protein